MIYTSEFAEKSAVMRAAELMAAAARTAPKACGIDAIKTMIIDGEDKSGLAVAIREIGTESDRPFFIRDAGNVDACHCILLIGAGVEPRGLNCSLCGTDSCAAAIEGGIPCAMAVNDLGIAVGSAVSVAMDHRIDNRIMFTIGMAALRLKLFPDEIRICFGIPLSTTGKSIFFDRPLP